MSVKKTSLIVIPAAAVVLAIFLFLPNTNSYDSKALEAKKEERKTAQDSMEEVSEAMALSSLSTLETVYAKEEEEEEKFVATHVETPEQVKAIYMSSWVAGTPSFREKLVKIADETEINAVIIDIKDYTGKVSFKIDEKPFNDLGSTENRIPDIKQFIARLHDKGIYVIGRISVFQDPHLVSVWPEEAVKKASDKTLVWKDHKGLSFIDAGSEKAWEYNIDLAKISYEYGFDEINFDYIRFPSDGNMKDIYYPHSEGKVKHEVMKSFFEYVNSNLKNTGVKTSADLFGMTATNTDDLGIGQVLEDALLNFDFVAPMVYPSHFPNNWAGMAKPAEKPYDVIYQSMGKAVERAEALGVDPLKLRPWLQDFDLGANYTKEMVEAQIKATYDVGLNSWMLWDPKNIYTKEALILE